jgi:hypothetical protein
VRRQDIRRKHRNGVVGWLLGRIGRIVRRVVVGRVVGRVLERVVVRRIDQRRIRLLQ